MEQWAIRVRERVGGQLRDPEPEPVLDVDGDELPVQEEQAAPETRPLDRGQLSLNLQRAGKQAESPLDTWILVGVSVAAWVAFVAAAEPVAAACALSVALGCMVHLALSRPIYRMAQAISAESERLRAALTCPYCRDHLSEDAAMVCDRTGCGAFYHVECWDEIRPVYGGCAIYGCGSSQAHLVGRFALQRRLLRLLLAAALFPPNMVKRLRDSERISFREVWRDARQIQTDISNSTSRTLIYGLLNFAVCLGLAIALVETEVMRPRTPWTVLAFLGILVLPILLIRMPLIGSFSWGASRLLASVFREELAALSRADEGTFLARLANYTGK